MQPGLLNVVIDGFWGSSGKGKVCDYLTKKYKITDVISGNMPNAGHTVVRDNRKVIAKVLPSASFFNNVDIWISGSTGFNVDQMITESNLIADYTKKPIMMSDRAFEVKAEHLSIERYTLNKIASTMQGSGAALAGKIMRTGSLRSEELPINVYVETAALWRRELLNHILNGKALYEVAQGWGLSIDHGTHYPQCTSRNCSINRALDDCATPPQLIGDVIAVIRPYPIRVGNTEGGHSGGWMPDCTEVSWDHIKKISGINEDLAEKERTTVTKRIRRVATFSFELLKDCVIHNGVTGIFLNFAQYIDSSCAGKRGKLRDAPKAVKIFVDAIENHCGVPVIALGTGADTDDVLD